jgi:hypothetical protein
MYKKGIIIFILVFSAVYLGTSWLNRSLPEGHIIMTRVAADNESGLMGTGIEKLELQNAQIVSFDPEKPESSIKVLTRNFASAISPELSSDNRQLVFAGKKEGADNWQIWMLNLGNLKSTQITDNSRDCFDPVFLPDERIAFSCTWDDERFGKGSTLYSANFDGSHLNPITFHPHTDHSNTMLHDGRILMVSQQIYPKTDESNLLALRPDGTKSGLFYKIPDDYEIISKARENIDNNIFFAAVNKDNSNSTVLQLSYNNPHNSKQVIYSSEAGRIHSLYPANDGNLFISYRAANSETFGIYKLDLQGEVQPVFTDNGYNFFEPSFIEEKPFIPRKLPSALSDARNFGIVVFVETPQALAEAGTFEGHTIQVVGVDGVLDEFPVKEDGSFYIRMGAKTPVRFQRLNEQNEIVKGPTSWLWFMNGERRGFTGWDEKQLTAPANRVPEAINHPFVEISGFDSPILVIQNDEKMLSEAGYEN